MHTRALQSFVWSQVVIWDSTSDIKGGWESSEVLRTTLYSRSEPTLTCGVVHLQFISISAGTIETSNCISADLLAASIQCLTLIHIYYKLGSNLGRKEIFFLSLPPQAVSFMRVNPVEHAQVKPPGVLIHICSQLWLFTAHSSISKAQYYTIIIIIQCMHVCVWWLYLPMQFSPFPLCPIGHGPHVAPSPGAATSVHSTPSKQISSVHPSKSSSQNLPV